MTDVLKGPRGAFRASGRLGATVQNAAGTIFVPRADDWLTVHVHDGNRWAGLRSRSPGDARDALFRDLGPQICKRLELTA